MEFDEDFASTEWFRECNPPEEFWDEHHLFEAMRMLLDDDVGGALLSCACAWPFTHLTHVFKLSMMRCLTTRHGRSRFGMGGLVAEYSRCSCRAMKNRTERYRATKAMVWGLYTNEEKLTTSMEHVQKEKLSVGRNEQSLQPDPAWV